MSILNFPFPMTEVTVNPLIHKTFQKDSGDTDPEDEEASRPGSDGYEDTNPEQHSRISSSSSSSSSPSPSSPTSSIIGWVETKYSVWNRRSGITNIEVLPSHRGRGTGRQEAGLPCG
jgi:ribosomal protein S18 acetylase RimI-like enzyme